MEGGTLMETNGENGTNVTNEANDTGKRLNAFVWIGFVLDLIGFYLALFMDRDIGIVVVVIALIFSIIGLILCIKRKGNVATATFFIVLDVAFLIYLVAFF